MDLRAKIIESSGINNEKGLKMLLRDTLYHARDNISVDKMKEAEAFGDDVKTSIDFRYQKFLKGLDPLLNNVKSNQTTQVAVDLLHSIFELIGVEIDKDECFLLYEMRDLGKFRLKEDQFYIDLEKKWRGSDFVLSKVDYKEALKGLKNGDLINFRRGSITLNESLIMRY